MKKQQILIQFQSKKAITTLTDLQPGYTPATLYEAYAPVLYGLIIKVLPNANDAADTMEELFAFLPLQMNEYNSSRGSVLTWLLNKARLLAMGKLYSQLVNPQQDYQYSSLPVAEKSVYILHHQLQYSTARIGGQLSLPVAAVEFLLRRATLKMQDLFAVVA